MNTIDLEEVKQFNDLSTQWWNENGPFKPLHQLNPTRIRFIRNEIINHFSLNKSENLLNGLQILDIGCGGGLIAEPLTRLKAKVTGNRCRNK